MVHIICRRPIQSQQDAHPQYHQPLLIFQDFRRVVRDFLIRTSKDLRNSKFQPSIGAVWSLTPETRAPGRRPRRRRRTLRYGSGREAGVVVGEEAGDDAGLSEVGSSEASYPNNRISLRVRGSSSGDSTSM